KRDIVKMLTISQIGGIIMKAVKKVKSQVETESDGNKDWRAWDPNTETVAEYECRLHGALEQPKESKIPYRVMGYLKPTELNPNWCESLRVDFSHEVEESEFHLDITTNDYHNCTCHKLACLTFFEWDGSKYIQVPLMSSDPTSKYLILGEVTELNKVYIRECSSKD
ncbi:MAG: hypothetical protein ACHQ6U_08595, partial [Thermodesulfobacteriota bacterium]